jgi:two-component sensor histidine kinase
MSLPPKKGLGLTLVEGFAQQIQGRVEYAKVDVGSKVILCFPVAERVEQSRGQTALKGRV